MAVDDLAMEGSTASAAIVFTIVSKNIPLLAPEGF